MSDFDLQRFLDAQTPVYHRVIAELGAGRKQSHWMWFIFPQLKGLGYSAMAAKYGVESLEEAMAYLEDAVLRTRLVECTRLVNVVEDKTVEEIFGYPDDSKFHSSMTLFAHAAGNEAEFGEALMKYFGGRLDPGTLERLQG